VLERVVPAGGDLRAALRAVLSAQDAVMLAARTSHEAGGGWGEDVLAAARDAELQFEG
jgi:hypothetical protein